MLFGANLFMSKHISHTKSLNSCFQFDLLHLFIHEMGMRYVSIQQAILFSICRISDICCAPSFLDCFVDVVSPLCFDNSSVHSNSESGRG